MANLIAQMLKLATLRKETALPGGGRAAAPPPRPATEPITAREVPPAKMVAKQGIASETLHVVRKNRAQLAPRDRETPATPGALQFMRDLARVRAQLLDRDDELAALQQVCDHLREEIEALRAGARQPGDAPARGAREKKELAALRAELATAHEHLATAQSRAAGAEQSAAESLTALTAERALHEQTCRTLEELRAAHADCGFALSAVEAQIEALRAAARGARKTAASDAPRAGAAAAPAGAAGDGPEVLLAAPQGTPDDLKQLNGVGPCLERRLNDLGIFHFRQIAALRPRDTAWIDARLGEHRGKIERDDWIGQAADLIAGRRHEKIF
jgi:predicted flap endonuclease-1-like 5' DNA nuclease